MVTINFTSAGGTQTVSYSMTCNKKPTFSVSTDATSWLEITNVSSTEPKITIKAKSYDSTSSAERIGFVIAKVGDNTCDGEKRLQVKQQPNNSQ